MGERAGAAVVLLAALTAVLEGSPAVLTETTAESPPELAAPSAEALGDGNNLYNFSKWEQKKHSAKKDHSGWDLAGGWHCDGRLHETLESGWVPNGEHERDTSPD